MTQTMPSYLYFLLVVCLVGWQLKSDVRYFLFLIQSNASMVIQNQQLSKILYGESFIIHVGFRRMKY